jgi:hypothetical protein
METIAFSSTGSFSGPWTELSLTPLGAGTKLHLFFSTLGPSRFNLPLPGVAPETAAVIPFEAPCIVYTGRTGSPGAYAGGFIFPNGNTGTNNGWISTGPTLYPQ